jgi:adenosylmethionine-8-amino-7-oxononanoate aminotransferase
MGMMCGLELDADKSTHTPFADQPAMASSFGNCCWESGLMVRGGHGKVIAALAPPLTLSTDEADEIVVRLGKALDSMMQRIPAAGH